MFTEAITLFLSMTIPCFIGIAVGELMEYTKRPYLCGSIGMVAGFLFGLCII